MRNPLKSIIHFRLKPITTISSKIVIITDQKRAIAANLTPDNYNKIIDEVWLVDSKNRLHYIKSESIKNKSYLSIFENIYDNQ